MEKLFSVLVSVFGILKKPLLNYYLTDIRVLSLEGLNLFSIIQCQMLIIGGIYPKWSIFVKGGNDELLKWRQ